MGMNRTIKPAISIIFLIIVFGATNCTYKNAQDVYPVNTAGCNIQNVSFKNDVVPILKANCYSCHDSANSFLGQGFVLQGYANDTLYVHNTNPNANMYNNVADPNTADLYHMPKGLPSISGCEILTIKAWIDQGYKNN